MSCPRRTSLQEDYSFILRKAAQQHWSGGLLFHSEQGCTTALVRLTDPPAHEEVDRVILWLQDSPKIHLDEALHHFRPDLVVADGSNASYLLPLWEESCRKQGIEFYCTQKKGAFLLKAPFE